MTCREWCCFNTFATDTSCTYTITSQDFRRWPSRPATPLSLISPATIYHASRRISHEFYINQIVRQSHLVTLGLFSSTSYLSSSITIVAYGRWKRSANVRLCRKHQSPEQPRDKRILTSPARYALLLRMSSYTSSLAFRLLRHSFTLASSTGRFRCLQ